MAEPFDRDLEGVFEHRAGDFSPELRELLRELWLEGVRHGRELERLEGHELRRRLERRGLERPAAVITSAASSGLELRPGELTLEHITRAAAELEATSPRPAALEPRFGFGRWLDDLADDRTPWRSSAHISHVLEDVRQSPFSRREFLGSWHLEESDE